MSTPEQEALFSGIKTLLAEIQTAAQRALPSNRELHEAFRMGAVVSTPAEAVAIARALEPALREHRMLLIGRGIDGAKATHLARLASTLAALLANRPELADGVKVPSGRARKRGAA